MPIAVLLCPSRKYVIELVPIATLFVESNPAVDAIFDNALVESAKLLANNALPKLGGAVIEPVNGSTVPAYNEYILLSVEYWPIIILFLGLSIKKSILLERLFVLVLLVEK